MKTFIYIIIFSCSLHVSYAQGMKKYDIGNSGCKAYFFCDPGEAPMSYSEDSSEIFTMECIADDLHYGLICVKYNKAVLPVKDPEGLMISYLDYLKQEFNIVESTGYGKGHTMNANSKATGVIDYWKDDSGSEWQIKSWTDGEYIGFMYVYANGAIPSDKASKISVFLDGFRFP